MQIENPIIIKLEKQKFLLEEKIKKLEQEKRNFSRKASECQVQVIGLNGELNAVQEIIKELKEK